MKLNLLNRRDQLARNAVASDSYSYTEKFDDDLYQQVRAARKMIRREMDEFGSVEPTEMVHFEHHSIRPFNTPYTFWDRLKEYVFGPEWLERMRANKGKPRWSPVRALKCRLLVIGFALQKLKNDVIPVQTDEGE